MEIVDVADDGEAVEVVDVADDGEATEIVDVVADDGEAMEVVDDVADDREATKIVDDVDDDGEATEIVDDVADDSEATEIVDDVADDSEATEIVDDVDDDDFFLLNISATFWEYLAARFKSFLPIVYRVISLNFKNCARLIYSKFHEKALLLISIYITVTKYPTKFKVINHISPSDQFGAFPCIFLQYQKFVKTSSKSKLKQMISIYGYMNNNSNSYLTHNFNIKIGEQYQ